MKHPPRHSSEPGRSFSEADSLYAQLFDLSPSPAVVTRLEDHTVVAINARTAEIVGISQRDAAGRSVSDFYENPSDRIQLIERLRRDGRADNFRSRIKRSTGESFWVLASSRLIAWQGQPAVLTVFHDISEQLAAEDTLRVGEQRLVAQSDALTSLTARYTNPGERFDERLRSILEISANALHVDRLSMWQFDDERSLIQCVGQYQPGGSQYVSGSVLHRADTPAYFEAVERDRVVAADDARTDPRTREFLETYLNPNGIGAMLDVPLRHENTTVGVLCAEHIGGARTWTVDEQNFTVSVANLIVVALAEEERRSALVPMAR